MTAIEGAAPNMVILLLFRAIVTKIHGRKSLHWWLRCSYSEARNVKSSNTVCTLNRTPGKYIVQTWFISEFPNVIQLFLFYWSQCFALQINPLPTSATLTLKFIQSIVTVAYRCTLTSYFHYFPIPYTCFSFNEAGNKRNRRGRTKGTFLFPATGLAGTNFIFPLDWLFQPKEVFVQEISAPVASYKRIFSCFTYLAATCTGLTILVNIQAKVSALCFYSTVTIFW